MRLPKVLLSVFFFTILAIFVYALPPSLTGINALQQVQQNSLQTIMPLGLTQIQGNPVNFYCCIDLEGKCIPNSSNSICQNPGPFSSPYSNVECTFNTSMSLGNYTARCIVVDNVSKQKSGIKSTAFSIIGEEIPEKEPCERSLFANTYCNPDGTKTTEISTIPINYLDENQSFKPIKKSLKTIDKALAKNSKIEKEKRKSDFDFENSEGLYTLMLKNNSAADNAVSFIVEDYNISFKILELYFEGTNKQSIGSTALKPGTASRLKNTLKFSNIFSNNINLEYDYNPSGMKERLVINSKNDLPLNSLGLNSNLVLKESFKIPQGLEMWVNGKKYSSGKISTSQKISFKTPEGVEKFFIPSPKAWDNAGKTIKLSYTLEKQENEIIIYSKTPFNWLSNSERIFPIIIDTSIELAVSNIESDGYVAQNYNEHTSEYYYHCSNDEYSIIVGSTANAAYTNYDCSSYTSPCTSCNEACNDNPYCCASPPCALDCSESDVEISREIYRGFIVFNVSSIPDNAAINSVALKLYTDYAYSGSVNVYKLNSSTSNCTVNDESFFLSLNGTNYLSNNTGFNIASQYNTVSLGNTAASDLASALLSDSFGVSITANEGCNFVDCDYTNSFTSKDNSSNEPLLVVNYVSNVPSTINVAFDSSKRLDSNSGKITISWNDATDETGYVVWRKNLGGDWVNVSGTLAANTTSYANDYLTDNNTLIYKLQTLGTASSSYSAQDSNITLDRTGPSVPLNFTASVSGIGASRHVDLNWFESDDNSSFAPLLDKNVVAYWRMDEGSGSWAFDSSGNDKNASFAAGNAAPTWVSSGKIGKALSFDGGDYASIGTSDLGIEGVGGVNGKRFAIAAWIKPASTSGQSFILSKDSTSARGFGFEINNGKLAFEALGNWVIQTSSTTLELNKWHFVVLDFNGFAAKIYLNGNLDGINASWNAGIPSTAAWLTDARIGSRQYTGFEGYYNGLIDELIVFDKNLSEADINKMYEIGKRKYLIARNPAFSRINVEGAGLLNEVFDDFSDNDYTNNPTWSIAQGGSNWSISSGRLSHNTTGSSLDRLNVTESILPGDAFSFEFDFDASSSPTEVGAFFGGFYVRYYGSNQIQAGAGGDCQVSPCFAHTFVSGEHWKGVYDGNALWFYINDSLIFTQKTGSDGTFGVAYDNDIGNFTAFWDNVRLKGFKAAGKILDVNSFADLNAVDVNAPNVPNAPSINNVSTTALDVNFTAVSDNGTVYDYNINVFDYFGNSSSPNFADNESFENDVGINYGHNDATANNGVADGWYVYSSGNSKTYSLVSQHLVDGNRGLSVYSPSTLDGHFGQSVLSWPAGTYRISFWYKTSNGSGNLSASYIRSGAGEAGIGSQALIADGVWRKYEKNFTSSTTLTQWFVRTNAFTGTVYFDAFRLELVSKLRPSTSATVTSGIKNYFIDCVAGGNCSESTSVFDDYNNSATGLRVSGLTPGTQYCFKVKAIDFADNNSALSSQTCRITSTTKPTFSIDYNSTNALNSSLGSINLYWNYMSGVSSFDVWRSSDYNKSWTLILQNTPNLSYNDSGLIDNNTFMYKITAHYTSIDVNSEIDSNITLDRTGPSVPLNFTASVSGIGASRHVDLNWFESDDNSSFAPLLDKNVVAYWRLEENNGTIIYDSSGNDNNGTINGAVWTTQGRIGNALSFDGVNDYVNVGNPSSLILSGSMSVSAWVKKFGSVRGNIISRSKLGEASADNILYQISILETNVVRFLWETGSGTNISCDSIKSISVGEWHNISVIRQTGSNSTVKIYIDGVLDSQCSGLTNPSDGSSSSQRVWIGRNNQSDNYFPFNGLIDELIVFNKTLSEADINKLYQIGVRRYGLERQVNNGGNWQPLNGLFDDFSDGDYTSGVVWSVDNSGSFSVVDGKLKMIPADDTYAGLVSGSFTPPYILEADVNIGTAILSFGICDVSITASPQVWANNTTSYFGGFGNDRTNNGFSVSWPGDSVKHVKIIVLNDFVKYYFNDVFIAEIPNVVSSIIACPVRLANRGSNGLAYSIFDNVKLTKLIDANTFADLNAVDVNAPNVPNAPSINNVSTTALDVNFTAVSDNGTDYNYLISAFDYFGNEAETISYYNLKTADDSSITSIDWPETTEQFSYFYSQPDFPRDLNIYIDNSNNENAVSDFTITISGINADWKSISENIQETVNPGEKAWFSTNNAFRRIGYITVSGDVYAYYAGSTVSIGLGSKLGLPNAPKNASEIFKCAKNDINTTCGNFNSTYGTIFQETILGGESFKFWLSSTKRKTNTTVTTGVKSYFIDCISGPGCSDSNSTNDDYNNSATGLRVSGLTPGTQYCFKVKAIDFADNNSALSSQTCQTTLNPENPTIQVDVNSAYALNSGLGGVRVSWSSVAGATGYDVWRSSDYNVSWQKIAANTINTDYNDLSLTDNNTLFYKITAHYPGLDVNSVIDANITLDRSAPSASSDLNVWVSPPDLNGGVGFGGITGGLVGYWGFEDLNADTNKTLDLSGNNNHGVLTNFACNTLNCNASSGWVSNGQVGKAMSFDGVNDYVLIQNNPALDFRYSPFSISYWAFLNSTANGQARIQNALQYLTQVYNGKFEVIVFNGVTPVVSNRNAAGGTTLQTGKWYHFVGVWDGSFLKTYVNGVLDRIGSNTISTGTAGNFAIGAAYDGLSNYHNGLIDEVKIFKRALSAKEIEFDYNAGLAKKSSKWASVNWLESVDAGNLGPLDKNLVAYWRFQEGSGTTAFDSSGNGNNGVLTSFACNTLNCNSSSGRVSDGRKGNAIVFDGVNDYVNVSSPSSDLNVSTVTVSAWVLLKRRSTANAPIFQRWGGDYQRSYQLVVNSTQQPSFYISTNGLASGNLYCTASMSIFDDRWHFLTGVSDGTNLKIFVDGALMNTCTGGSIFKPTTTSTFIGPLSYMSAAIDEVIVWNKALTDNEVNFLYQKGKLYYTLLRGSVVSDVNSLVVSDFNSTVFSDFSAVDLNAPSIPSVLSVGGATISSLDVNWSAVSDNGSVYYYRVKARDFEGNDVNAWSVVDGNVVTSGVWQYWLLDVNSGLEYGPFSGLGATVSGLSAGSEHCFRVKVQDFADNNSVWSDLACGSVIPTSVVLSSSSHPVEGAWYNSAVVSLTASGVFDHVNYYLSQNASETADTIRSFGTYDKDGSFSVIIPSDGNWFVHVVALNDQNQGSVTDVFQVNYDGTAPTASSIMVSEWSGGVVGFTSSFTPSLSVSASDVLSGLSSMSFSCNGSTWENWVSFASSYSSFNITTGAGCSVVCDGSQPDSNKVVYFKVKDNAGNQSSSVQTASFVCDNVAPSSNSVSVSSWTGQTGFTNDDTPPLSLSSNDAGGVYKVKWSCNNSDYSGFESFSVSKSDWDLKPSSETFGCGVGDGIRTVFVVFRDNAGNESSAVSTGSFVLDQTAPVSSNSSPVSGFRYSSPDPVLTSTVVEETAGLWKCFARIGSSNPPSAPIRIVEGSIEGSVCSFSGYSVLSEGTWYWDVNALDKAGNWGSYSGVSSFVRDNTAPTVPSVFTVENDSVAPYWDNVDNNQTNLFFTALESGESCKWDLTSALYSAMSNACSVNGTAVSCGFGDLGQTSTVSQYLTRYHSCVDDVGNAYAAQGISFGVDWTAPATWDNSDSSVHVPSYSVTLTESDNASTASDLVTFWCVDQSDSCSPVEKEDLVVDFLSDAGVRGVNYLRYYSVDLAGNQQSIVSKTINVNQLPVFSAADANVGNFNPVIKGGSSVLVSAVASDVDVGQFLKLFVCKSDDGSSSGCGVGGTYCSSVGSSNPSCVFTAELDNSSHSWFAYVFDSLNEASVSNPRSGSFTSDSTAPIITPSSPANASGTSDNTPTLTGIASETLSSCQVQIATDENFNTIVSGFNEVEATVSSGTICTFTVPTALSDGTYYWRMKATDLVGNVGDYDVNWSFTIDTNGAIATSIVSIAGDTVAPYWDVVNDSQTIVVVAGESGMSCRWGTEDVVYSLMSNDCSINGSQASCNLGSLSQKNLSTSHYVSCKDSVGNEQTSAQNVDLSFGVDWTAPSIGQTVITSSVVGSCALSPANIESSVVSDNVSLDVTSCEYTLNGNDWFVGTWSEASSKCVDNGVVLLYGSNTVNYRVKDSAGNVGIGTAVVRTKDVSGPEMPSLSFGTITSTSIIVNSSIPSDDCAGLHATPYYFSADNGLRSSGWISSNSWSDLGRDVNSLHSYMVKVKDALGNESSFTSLQSRFTLANVPGIPTVNGATVSSLNVSLDVNGNPAGTLFAIYDMNSPTSPWVQVDGSLGNNIVWQTNAEWGTKTVTGLTPGSQHCFKVKAKNGDNVQTNFSPLKCGTTTNYYVETIVKDVNGYFSPNGVWTAFWTNTDVNAKLICKGAGNTFEYLSFGGNNSWTEMTENDQNVSFDSGIYHDSANNKLYLLPSANSGNVYIKMTSGNASTSWMHYSAMIEPYNFNPNYVGVGVSYRTASTKEGLSSQEFIGEFPPNFELSGVSGEWIEYRIRLFRNSSFGTTTQDNIALKGFFSKYSNDSIDSSSSCNATYYRIDDDNSSAENFTGGTYYAFGRFWRVLGNDKNVLFDRDGNFALEFFSQSTSLVNENPKKINVLIKKSLETASLGNFCQGIQDSLSLNVNWNASTALEGVYKYRIYASTSPNFESKTLVFESNSTTSTSFSLTDLNLQVCGDGKCYYGENCPADSLNCPFGQVCSNGCQVQTSVTFSQTTTTCTLGMNNPGLDSYCRERFGANYACIDGCVPTSTNQFSSKAWSTTPASSSLGYCGDSYCDLNESCPKDNVYCPEGLVCNYGCRQSSSVNVCGDGVCSSMEHCIADSVVCLEGYACLSGCVPTSTASITQAFTPKYQLNASSSRNPLNPCGDGFCETLTTRKNSNQVDFSNEGLIDEYCVFDNRYCTAQGFIGGICAGGCRTPFGSGSGALPSTYTILRCGDGVCGIGENCPLDNSGCGAGKACLSGCVEASGDYVNNPLKTKFNPYKGSFDGKLWFQLELETNTGSRSLSIPQQCEIDYESPFKVPFIQGRRLQKTISNRSIDLNIPANSISAGVDANIIIDINTSPPIFAKGSLLQAFDLEADIDLNFSIPARFKVDFNKQALPCWPACTLKDANKLAFYDYNADSNIWVKLPTIVDWDNNQMWVDLNKI